LNGKIQLSRALTLPEYQYLMAFGKSRRMTYNVESQASVKDPIRERVGLPIGTDGEYIVHGQEPPYGRRGKGEGDSNRPPADQPGLWCEWRPSVDGDGLVYESSERDYDYQAGAWLTYIAEKILAPWGITAEGRAWYRDEEGAGVVLARGGKVYDLNAVLAYTDPETQETVLLREGQDSRMERAERDEDEDDDDVEDED
jgi:hypothetical protein